jgi:beta-barrel assembly-enhancing protease
MTNINFNGGLFHPQIPTRRAQAKCHFYDIQILFETEHGDFELDYEDANVRIGGSTGRMWFIENDTKDICFFSEDPHFVEQLQKSYLQKQYEHNLAKHRSILGISTVLWSSVIGISFFCLYGLYLAIPQIALASLSSIPIVVDEKIGKLSASQMDHGGVEIHDEKIVQPIEQMVQRLSDATQIEGTEEKFDFDVHVVQSDVQNAYALPGGYIVLYTGLIESSSSPEQIAGVLAHEMAHVTERHGLIKVMETASISALVTFLIGDVEGIIALGAQLLSHSTVSSYSRESETQADEVGLETMYRANINPQGMLDFFATLDKNDDLESELTNSIPTWMQSHPKHQDRISHLQNILETHSTKNYKPLDIDFEALQQAIKAK